VVEGSSLGRTLAVGGAATLSLALATGVALSSGGVGTRGGGTPSSRHAASMAGEIIAAPTNTERTTSLSGERPAKDIAPA
jgi:hypothetical protein